MGDDCEGRVFVSNRIRKSLIESISQLAPADDANERTTAMQFHSYQPSAYENYVCQHPTVCDTHGRADFHIKIAFTQPTVGIMSSSVAFISGISGSRASNLDAQAQW